MTVPSAVALFAADILPPPREQAPGASITLRR